MSTQSRLRGIAKVLETVHGWADEAGVIDAVAELLSGRETKEVQSLLRFLQDNQVGHVDGSKARRIFEQRLAAKFGPDMEAELLAQLEILVLQNGIGPTLAQLRKLGGAKT